MKSFGKALRAALTFERDYASLMDLENAETPEDFAEAIKRFLRRNYRGREKQEAEAAVQMAGGEKAETRHFSLPSESQLERLMSLIEDREDVRIVRNAIVSYGLARWERRQASEETLEEETE